jgi:hypothetical protein
MPLPVSVVRVIMLRNTLILTGMLLWWASGPAVNAQAFPADAWGLSMTSSDSTQTSTTTITETNLTNRSGFAIAGENVTTLTPNQPINATPTPGFTILNPQQQFNLGIDQFTAGPSSTKVTTQSSTTLTNTRNLSVFY